MEWARELPRLLKLFVQLSRPLQCTRKEDLGDSIRFRVASNGRSDKRLEDAGCRESRGFDAASELGRGTREDFEIALLESSDRDYGESSCSFSSGEGGRTDVRSCPAMAYTDDEWPSRDLHGRGVRIGECCTYCFASLVNSQVGVPNSPIVPS